LNGRKSKEIRKAANEAAALTGRVAGEGLAAVIEYARKIELKAEALETELGEFRGRSFSGRVSWLLTGR